MSVVGFVVRLVGCLAVVAATAGLYAAWEATPAGGSRIWMFGASILAVPLLIVLAEMASNPVLDCLDSQPWWAKAGPAVRIAVGVLITLPFGAFLVVILAAFRRALGAGQ